MGQLKKKKPGPKPGTNTGPRGRDTPHKKWHREYMRRRVARERREEAQRKKKRGGKK